MFSAPWTRRYVYRFIVAFLVWGFAQVVDLDDLIWSLPHLGGINRLFGSDKESIEAVLEGILALAWVLGGPILPPLFTTSFKDSAHQLRRTWHAWHGSTPVDPPDGGKPRRSVRKNNSREGVRKSNSADVESLLDALRAVVSTTTDGNLRRDQIIVALYDAGLSFRRIAPHAAVSYATVREIVQHTRPDANFALRRVAALELGVSASEANEMLAWLTNLLANLPAEYGSDVKAVLPYHLVAPIVTVLQRAVDNRAELSVEEIAGARAAMQPCLDWMLGQTGNHKPENFNRLAGYLDRLRADVTQRNFPQTPEAAESP